MRAASPSFELASAPIELKKRVAEERSYLFVGPTYTTNHDSFSDLGTGAIGMVAIGAVESVLL